MSCEHFKDFLYCKKSFFFFFICKTQKTLSTFTFSFYCNTRNNKAHHYTRSMRNRIVPWRLSGQWDEQIKSLGEEWLFNQLSGRKMTQKKNSPDMAF